MIGHTKTCAGHDIDDERRRDGTRILMDLGHVPTRACVRACVHACVHVLALRTQVARIAGLLCVKMYAGICRNPVAFGV